MKALVTLLAGIAVSMVTLWSGAHAADGILVQSTTSTQNSGLYEHLLPMFRSETGIEVRVVAVGTGQAIRNAINGDADVLLVHAKAAEEKFVADGWGVSRADLMYNDFVVVGPRDDPAGVAGMTDAIGALNEIAGTQSIFASRGDDSGTHKAEMRLWRETGVDAEAASGTWYRETGSGMGATLNVGIGMRAYVLTDRATWIAFSNKQDHVVLVEGDPRLFNQYGIMQVNPAMCPRVKAQAAKRFVDWIITRDGQSAIAAYKLDGRQLSFANAAKEGAS